MKFNPIFSHIVTDTISYAWFLALQEVMTKGRIYEITAGSLDYEGNYRATKPLVIEMHKPGTRPLAPYINEALKVGAPTTEDKIQEYMEYLVTINREETEHYTYGEDLSWEVEEVIRYYKKHGFGTACCTMMVGRPECLFHYNWDVDYDEHILLKERDTGKVIFNRHLTNTWNKDPQIEVSSQCLRAIDTWVQDGKLYFVGYFRSQDLWGGFPQNYGGIQLLKEYMAGQIGVEDGPLIAISKDLHVYKDGIDFALAVINKTRKEVGLPEKPSMEDDDEQESS